MEPENKVGEIFRNALKEHKVQSDSSLWTAIDARLSSVNPTINKKSFRVSFWLKIAASIFIFAGVSFAFNLLFKPFDVSEITPESFLKYKKNSSENYLITDTVKSDTLLNSEILITKSPSPNNQNVYVNNNLQIEKKIKDTINLHQNRNTDSSFYDKLNYDNIKAISENSETDLSNEPLFKNSSNYIPVEAKVDDRINNTIEKEFLNIEIPNIFTPNGDGYNDYFVIKNITNYQNQLLITDRNGRVVFEKVNYQNDWDGKNLPNGVYFFILKCKHNSQDFVKTGSISIIR